MSAIAIIVNIILVSFAVIAPWATISAFKASGRLAGWMMTWATLVAHVYVWFVLGHSPELGFFFGPLWGGYEFVCTLAPLGLDEETAEVAEATNKG